MILKTFILLFVVQLLWFNATSEASISRMRQNGKFMFTAKRCGKLEVIIKGGEPGRMQV